MKLGLLNIYTSFPLSLPENYHQNIRKFAQMVKLNGIKKIKIQSEEKGRGSDSYQLEADVCRFISSSFAGHVD